MKFLEIAAQDALTRQIAAEVVKTSPLLADYVQFFAKPGNSVSVRAGGSIDGVVGSTRAIGSDYTAKTVAPSYKTASRKFIGDKVQMDMAYEKMGYDIPSEMAAQLKRRGRELGFKFNYFLIKGDSSTDANQFNGLEKLVTENQTITAATNGLTVSVGNSDTAKKSQQEFLELLDEAVAKCEGVKKVIIMPDRGFARLNSIARDYIDIERNEFGVPVAFYNTIPVLAAGNYLSAVDTYTPVLGANETCGTGTKTSSVYVASFEEEDGLSFATTQGGFQVYPTQKVGNFLETTLELITDSMLIRGTAVSRLKGLVF